MITCIIAEKPSVARDIARIVGANTRQDGYLEGNGYMVTWAMGHLSTRHHHRDYNFTELTVETVSRSLHHSCRSELTRQGISLP